MLKKNNAILPLIFLFVSPLSADLSQSYAPDPAALHNIKRIAVMPFYITSAVTNEDITFKDEKFKEYSATLRVQNAAVALSRFQVVDLADVGEALKKNGFVGIQLAPGEQASLMKMAFNPDKYRVGLSIHEVMAAGRDLHADAVLMGAYGVFGPPLTGNGNNMKLSLVMRLYDPNTKKFLWGASRTVPAKVSIFHPFDSQNKQIQELAKDMLSEIPQ